MIFSEKDGGFISAAKTLSLLASFALLQACGADDGDSIENTAPTVTSVVITDTNGADAVVGDILIANYVYADIENDAEGESAIRWLRNDVIISRPNQWYSYSISFCKWC